MNRKNKFLIFAGFALLAGGVYLLSKYKLSQINTPIPVKNAPAQKTYRDLTPLFHADSVQVFKWKSKKQVFVMKRVTQDFQIIQEHLNLLSFIHLKKIEPYQTKPIIEVTVTFRNGESWTAYWNGQQLYWSSGPKKNFGCDLMPEDLPLLWTGNELNTKKTLNLCTQEVSSIQNFDPVFKIQNLNGQWKFTNNETSTMANQPHDINTNISNVNANDKKRIPFSGHFVEEWLSKHCIITIDQWIDADLIQEAQVQRLVDITYKQKSQLHLAAFKDQGIDLFSVNLDNKNKKIFRSKHLQSAIIKLKQLP